MSMSTCGDMYGHVRRVRMPEDLQCRKVLDRLTSDQVSPYCPRFADVDWRQLVSVSVCWKVEYRTRHVGLTHFADVGRCV